KSPSAPGTSTCWTSPENSSFSGETSSKWKLAIVISRSGRFRRELLALLDCLFDRADHVEGGLGQMIVLAVAETLESFDGVLKIDEFSGRAREHFGDVERLRQEALDFACASDSQFVVFGQFIHAQNGDDVLQRLVTLENLL